MLTGLGKEPVKVSAYRATRNFESSSDLFVLIAPRQQNKDLGLTSRESPERMNR